MPEKAADSQRSRSGFLRGSGECFDGGEVLVLLARQAIYCFWMIRVVARCGIGGELGTPRSVALHDVRGRLSVEQLCNAAPVCADRRRRVRIRQERRMKHVQIEPCAGHCELSVHIFFCEPAEGEELASRRAHGEHSMKCLRSDDEGKRLGLCADVVRDIGLARLNDGNAREEPVRHRRKLIGQTSRRWFGAVVERKRSRKGGGGAHEALRVPRLRCPDKINKVRVVRHHLRRVAIVHVHVFRGCETQLSPIESGARVHDVGVILVHIIVEEEREHVRQSQGVDVKHLCVRRPTAARPAQRVLLTE
mmetsp:Transcript_20424/g.66312  ORF Transcript_20424/g.66312 Transcript_20424/m.66312 type:complete len:306 (-) Transcript_20424:736-1653(-)